MRYEISEVDFDIAVKKAWEDTSADADFKNNLGSRLSKECKQKGSVNHILLNLIFVLMGLAVCAAIAYGLWLPTTLNFVAMGY